MGRVFCMAGISRQIQVSGNSKGGLSSSRSLLFGEASPLSSPFPMQSSDTRSLAVPFLKGWFS